MPQRRIRGQRCANTLPFDHLHNQAMPQFRPLPPFEEVQKAFNYNPDTGIITHAYRKCGKALAGSNAGFVAAKGYLLLTHNYVTYRCNRIAWLLGNGEDPGNFIVEHQNRNKADNRLCNLRLATDTQNKHNVVHRGWTLNNGKFRVRIRFEGRSVAVGAFSTAAEAEEAYRQAKLQYHGEFSPEEYKN